MRKLAFVIAVLLAASLSACGGASKTDSSSGGTHTSDTTSSTPPATTPPATTTSSGSGSGGSDPGSTYCTDLRTAKAELKSLDVTSLTASGFTKLTQEFGTLASDAPDAVKADWATLTTALTKIQQILSNAGLSFSDLQGLSSGHLPKGVTQQQLVKLGKQFQAFSQNSGFAKASAEITAHAKAECGVNLNK
jgi:hypothetical protein